MTETIEDVKGWIELALAAVFLDDASQQARGHRPYVLRLDEKHEGEGNSIGLTGLIEIDAFTITPARWEDVYGLLHRRQAIEGWLLEVAVSTGGSCLEPPDVDIIDVGVFDTAHKVAYAVVEKLILNRLTAAMEAEDAAREEAERRKQAEEVF